MHCERVPKDNFPIPYVIDYPLNYSLAEKPLCMSDRSNLQSIQSKELGVWGDIYGICCIILCIGRTFPMLGSMASLLARKYRVGN